MQLTSNFNVFELDANDSFQLCVFIGPAHFLADVEIEEKVRAAESPSNVK